MSWAPYLDSIKSKCDGLVALGIYGDNGVAWATEGCTVTASEISGLCGAFKGSLDLFNHGFTLEGNRFVLTKVDQEDQIMIGKGRKKEEGNKWGTGPFTAMKIKGAMVFAVGNSEIQGGAVNTAVSHIAEFLRDNGYMP